MSIKNRIDPEARVPLEGLLEAIPGGFNSIPDINVRRATLDAVLKAGAADVPPNDNVSHEDRQVPGPAGDPEITVRI